MAVVDIPCQQSHAHDFEHKVHGRHVEQTEQEQPCRTEIKRQQSVPCNHGQRTVVEVLYANLPQYVKEPYRRFLENKLRDNWTLTGTPINVFIRQK